jgi:putative redox protein
VSDTYRVRLATVGDGPMAHGTGTSGPASLVVDRPVAAGGGGLGFNGGQLFYLAIAACWSNDLYREAATMGIALDAVAVTVDGDFPERGGGSTPITVDVSVTSAAPEDRVRELIAEVERIAEIPRAIREGPPIEVRAEVMSPG